MAPDEFSRLYDAYYYAHGCGPPYARNEEWLRFFAFIADRIVTDIRPSTVLDVGCAMGFLVEGLRQRGVEAYGVDISEYAIQKVDPSIRPYCWVGSIAEAFPRKYDLIVCIEVLEHIPPSKADEAVKNCCLHSDNVLFSSTPFDYKEFTHLNVRPPEYWADLFARHGFLRDVDFDASFITPWAVRFCLRNEPLHSIVKDYERKYWLLWKETVDLRQSKLEMRDQLASNEQALQTLKDQMETKDQIAEELKAQVMELKRTREEPGQQTLSTPPGTRRERILRKLFRIGVNPRSVKS